MRLVVICLLILIGLMVVYLIVHRIFLNRATMIMHRQNEQVLDAAVNTSLEEILPGIARSKSQLVADVWGKGVMAFEYAIDTRQAAYQDDRFSREVVNQALRDYADQHNIKSSDPTLPAILVTDWWQYQGIIHLDVAYLSNEATAEYVKDLKTLANPSESKTK